MPRKNAPPVSWRGIFLAFKQLQYINNNSERIELLLADLAYFFAGSAAGAAGAAAAGAGAGAAGFSPQAERDNANKAATSTEYFISFP